MMGHYLLNFVLTTMSVVGLLYLLYLYIKQNPQINGKTYGPKQSNGLKIESILTLEPRKNLYIVRYGQQRFLIATTVDKTEFLATLEADPSLDTAMETAETSQVSEVFNQSSSFKDRFQNSLRMVLAEKFNVGRK